MEGNVPQEMQEAFHVAVALQPAHCRWDISLVSNAPIGTGFGPQNITVIMSQESHHQHVFLIRIAETIFHIRSKLRRNYAIKCVYFLRFQRWYIRPNPCIIDGDVITTWIFTGFGKSVHRAVWRGFWHCLERRTSGLVIVESIRVLGPSFNPQKKTSFAQDSWISYRLQLVWPISPLLLYGFQSNLVSLERYFRGESNALCYEERGLLLMENVGNYRNCATRIIPEILVVIKSGLLLSGRLPFCQDVLLQFGTDLGDFGPEI